MSTQFTMWEQQRKYSGRYAGCVLLFVVIPHLAGAKLCLVQLSHFKVKWQPILYTFGEYMFADGLSGLRGWPIGR
jgi:hypothetical protein